MNKSYKIFITKSREAAELIANALLNQAKGDEIPDFSVSNGPTINEPHIPTIYQEVGFFFAAISIRNEKQKYELIIC